MSDVFDEQGDVNWRTVMDRLGKGQVVEIPCATEREVVRRATQVVKRAEKQHLGIEVLRGENALRIEPRAGDDRVNRVSDGEGETREDRQRERVKRRDVARPDRGAGRGKDRQSGDA